MVRLSQESGDNTTRTTWRLHTTWKRADVFQEKSDKKIIGREARQQKPHRVTGGDIQTIESMMSAEQKGYVDDMVHILSSDMAKIGNEASMRMYGIEKYKEDYYFPFAVWDGVKNKGSDAGAGSQQKTSKINRAAG